MSRVEVRIATNGAAFRDADDELVTAEVRRLLEHAATLISEGFRDGHLRDVNGNRCGDFTVIEDGGPW